MDFAALAIILICVLFGLYRGFIQSVLSLGGSLLSIVGSFLLYPHLADIVASNTDITRMISTYTDSQSLLGDLDLSSQAVSGLAGDAITQVVQKANLPTPIDTLLQHNLSAQVFRPLGSLATNVGDYVNQTILSVSINVLCFLLCFVACFIVVHILINLVRAVFRFPVLKHLDWLAGGAFGFLVGVLLCYVCFTVLPLLESMIPIEDFRTLADQSVLAKSFSESGLIVSIMNRKL
ncbi:MAG: CvpA family protein [Candidatus Limiplasma sp.]|nr:CvpA family protein [Candidatus Limiplasma sp.]